jgi:DNA-binding NarL/FixJ family response regulator
MYRKRKRCFLCDTLIYYNRAACKEHAALYNQYKDEQWCIEIVAMENRQGYIESKETTSITSVQPKVLLLAHPLESKANIYENRRKEVLNLYMHGMRIKDIAIKLSMSLGTVKSIVRRARLKDA